LEKLLEYRDRGWRFALKTVKGKKYITVRRGGKTESLGSYNDETWRLIQEICGEDEKPSKSPSSGSMTSSQVGRVNVSDALIGLKVVKAVKALRKEPSDILGFIEDVYKEAISQHLDPENFVKIALGMYDMKVEEPKDYQALSDEVRDKKSLYDNLGKKVSELEGRADELSKANMDAEGRLEETSRLLKSKSELIGKVKEAEDLDLTPLQFGVIIETARKVGARHGKGVKESITCLVKDLVENWEPMLGFEDGKTGLKVELNQLREKIKLAEGEERLTNEKVRAQEEALSGLEELKKHVSPGELVEFKKMIVDSGGDVASFRSEVLRLGGVTSLVDQVVEKRAAEQAKLEGRVTELRVIVARLEKAKTGLETEISTLNSDTIKALEGASKTITAIAEVLRRDFEDPETGYKVRIQSLGEDAVKETEEELKAKREALGQSMDGLRSFVNRSLVDVENLKKETWDTAKVLGFNIHLTRLAWLIAGDPVGRVEALATMKMTVDAFIDYLKRNQMYNKYPSAATFSAELRSIGS
jgi:hypothetical protein